jgi:hypothetical protein
MRRVLRITGIVVLAMLLVAGLALFIALRSGFLHERLRVAIESGVAGAIDGTVSIGELRGGLLGDATLINIRITSRDGTPFIAIDTLRGNYSLPMLLRRDYIFSNVRVVRPVVFLEQRTGEPWNYARIFRLKSDTARPDTIVAPRMRVALNDAELVDGTVNLRAPWRPDSTLSPADSERSIAEALSDSNIFRIERAGNTYQMIQQYSSLNAVLPRARIISADESPMRFEIGRLEVLALITRTEPLDIRNASGVLEIARDSLRFFETSAQLPASFLRGEGSYRLTDCSPLERARRACWWRTSGGLLRRSRKLCARRLTSTCGAAPRMRATVFAVSTHVTIRLRLPAISICNSATTTSQMPHSMQRCAFSHCRLLCCASMHPAQCRGSTALSAAR